MARRGEIWTVASGTGYASKPRPAVVIQDDSFDATDSVTVCVFTTDPTDAPLFRLPVTPTPGNGLREPSSLMVDKITTIRRSNLGDRIGELPEPDLLRLKQAMMVFLGLAASPRRER